MIRRFFYILLLAISLHTSAQTTAPFEWNRLPVKALLLSCPEPRDVPLLCHFITDALPKEGVNTLCLRIEYQYQFESHPELADVNALSKAQLQSVVALSTTEAEYTAAAEAVKEAIWLKGMLKELGVNQRSIMINYDS